VITSVEQLRKDVGVHWNNANGLLVMLEKARWIDIVPFNSFKTRFVCNKRIVFPASLVKHVLALHAKKEPSLQLTDVVFMKLLFDIGRKDPETADAWGDLSAKEVKAMTGLNYGPAMRVIQRLERAGLVHFKIGDRGTRRKNCFSIRAK
jgi:hypothetical protein